MRDILRRLLPGGVMLLGISLVMLVASIATSVTDGGHHGPVAQREFTTAVKANRLPVATAAVPGVVVEIDRGAGPHAQPPWRAADDEQQPALDRHWAEPDFGSRHVLAFEPPDLPPSLTPPAFDAELVRPQHPRPRIPDLRGLGWVTCVTRVTPPPADPGPATNGPRWPTYVSRARADEPD